MSVLVAGNVLKTVAKQVLPCAAAQKKNGKDSAVLVGPFLGQRNLASGRWMSAKSATQRKIGPTQATRHCSRSLSRFLHPRDRDRGQPRLAKTASVPSHGKEDTWNSTLREKSVVKTEQPAEVTSTTGSPSSSGNEPRAETLNGGEDPQEQLFLL